MAQATFAQMKDISVDFVWIVAFSLLSFSFCDEGRGEIIGYNCSNEKSPDNSFYLSNRMNLFSNLESIEVHTANFSSNFSQSEEGDGIFGFVQCHGLSRDACYSCIITVIDKILEMCGNAENAYMWLEGCFLRYGKKNMTSLEDSSRNLTCSGKYIGTQPQKFAAVVNKALGKLNSSTNGRNLPVVPGRINSSKNGSDSGAARWYYAAYGKAQCYLHLLQTDCERCIENSKIYAQKSPVSQNCSALQIWSESCFLKYWVSYPDPHPHPAVSPPRRIGSLDGSNNQLPSIVPSAAVTAPPQPVSTGTELDSSLDWNRRKSIAVGVARGLAYLHEESQPRIVHRDIKAGNILLDDNYNAKISDFGLARLFPEFGSHVSTRVAGTFGYLAPEYAVRGQLTEKADIFSFGVLFLEIISGRQNLDITLSPQRHFLLEWAWKLYELGDVWGIVDPKIDANHSREDIERSIEIAFLCVQGTAQLRPSMSQVVGMMRSQQPIHMYPEKPALLDLLSSRDRNRGRDSGGSIGSTHNAATSSGGAASSSISSDIFYLEPR